MRRALRLCLCLCPGPSRCLFCHFAYKRTVFAFVAICHRAIDNVTMKSTSIGSDSFVSLLKSFANLFELKNACMIARCVLQLLSIYWEFTNKLSRSFYRASCRAPSANHEGPFIGATIAAVKKPSETGRLRQWWLKKVERPTQSIYVSSATMRSWCTKASRG